MAYVKSTNSEVNKLNFKRTSSLNNYYLCDYCQRKFPKKEVIQQHVVTCLSNRTCKWCSIVFKNRGNLVTHAYYVHNDKSLKTKQAPSNTCEACCKSFSDTTALKYHIRRAHFNLVAEVTSYDQKAIDEVWYENVLNGDSVVEIKKAAPNLLLIRKVDSNEQVNLNDGKVSVNLTTLYPTGNSMTTMICDICEVEMLKRDFKKHYDEKHGQLRKHHCNNCNVTFKRSYLFIRHKCNKNRTRRKRMPQISKVESYTAISV